MNPGRRSRVLSDEIDDRDWRITRRSENADSHDIRESRSHDMESLSLVGRCGRDIDVTECLSMSKASSVYRESIPVRSLSYTDTGDERRISKECAMVELLRHGELIIH